MTLWLDLISGIYALGSVIWYKSQCVPAQPQTKTLESSNFGHIWPILNWFWIDFGLIISVVFVSSLAVFSDSSDCDWLSDNLDGPVNNSAIFSFYFLLFIGVNPERIEWKTLVCHASAPWDFQLVFPKCLVTKQTNKQTNIQIPWFQESSRLSDPTGSRDTHKPDQLKNTTGC